MRFVLKRWINQFVFLLYTSITSFRKMRTNAWIESYNQINAAAAPQTQRTTHYQVRAKNHMQRAFFRNLFGCVCKRCELAKVSRKKVWKTNAATPSLFAPSPLTSTRIGENTWPWPSILPMMSSALNLTCGQIRRTVRYIFQILLLCILLFLILWNLWTSLDENNLHNLQQWILRSKVTKVKGYQGQRLNVLPSVRHCIGWSRSHVDLIVFLHGFIYLSTRWVW